MTIVPRTRRGRMAAYRMCRRLRTVLVGSLYHLRDLVDGEVLASLDGQPLDVDVGDLTLQKRTTRSKHQKRSSIKYERARAPCLTKNIRCSPCQ
jgi:hypothetical protein